MHSIHQSATRGSFIILTLNWLEYLHVIQKTCNGEISSMIAECEDRFLCKYNSLLNNWGLFPSGVFIHITKVQRSLVSFAVDFPLLDFRQTVEVGVYNCYKATLRNHLPILNCSQFAFDWEDWLLEYRLNWKTPFVDV